MLLPRETIDPIEVRRRGDSRIARLTNVGTGVLDGPLVVIGSRGTISSSTAHGVCCAYERNNQSRANTVRPYRVYWWQGVNEGDPDAVASPYGFDFGRCPSLRMTRVAGMASSTPTVGVYYPLRKAKKLPCVRRGMDRRDRRPRRSVGGCISSAKKTKKQIKILN